MMAPFSDFPFFGWFVGTTSVRVYVPLVIWSTDDGKTGKKTTDRFNRGQPRTQTPQRKPFHILVDETYAID